MSVISQKQKTTRVLGSPCVFRMNISEVLLSGAQVYAKVPCFCAPFVIMRKCVRKNDDVMGQFGTGKKGALRSDYKLRTFLNYIVLAASYVLAAASYHPVLVSLHTGGTHKQPVIVCSYLVLIDWQTLLDNALPHTVSWNLIN